MSSEVSVSARVVAAGPAGDGRVRLTISFMPVLDGSGIKVDMKSWPLWTAQVEKALNATEFNKNWLRLAVVPIPISSDARPYAPTAEIDTAPLRYEPSRLDLDQIQKLWNEVAEDALKGYDKLGNYAALKDPLKRKQRLDELFPQFWSALAGVFKSGEARYTRKADDGAGDVTIPDVLGTGRADAAVLHLMSRAKRLVERVAGKGENLSANPDGELPGRPVDKWEKISEADLKLLTFDIKRARDVLDGKLAEAQKAEQQQIANAADDYVEDSKDYLVAASRAVSDANVPTTAAGQKFPSYERGDVPAVLAGYSIGELLETSESGDDTILKQIQNLHLASLLPDEQRKEDPRPKGALSQGNAERLESSNRPFAPVRESMDFVARTFVAAVRSSPMLARLFRFVIDVEVQLPSLPKTIPNPNDKEEDCYAFAFLGAAIAAQVKIDPKALMFSLAKATWAQKERNSTRSSAAVKEGELTGFWPATREELDLRCEKQLPMSAIRQKGVVSQIDGVVDLGQATEQPDGKLRNPRFDIVTIDPVLAMEASVRNARRKAALAGSAAWLGLASEARGVFDGEPEPGLVTRGLSIVDRRRAESVAKEIMTAGLGSNVRILDADDLTIGYRVDVAVRVGDVGVEWRSLMEREIDYRRVGHENDAKDEFRDWFEALGHGELTFETGRRRDLDAGIMMQTSRRRLFVEDDKTREMVHAEERLATWAGDPLGLNCHSDEVIVRPGSDVAISRTYSLPSEADEDDRKAWPLRYGWAYRFGIRPVWLGGVSLSLDKARIRYDSQVAGYRGLTLPGELKVGKIEARSWRRFLRHEPVLAPVVLLPHQVAKERGKSDLPPQSGIRAILRTLAVGLDANHRLMKAYGSRQTADTWRVIVPPQISLDEAVRHGMFDQEAEVGKVPPGKLLRIDYDTPVRAATDPQTELGQKQNGFPTLAGSVGTDDTGDGSANGERENIFRVHDKPRKASDRRGAAEQYYVDPMAKTLVVAVRPNTNRPGTGYFDGKRLSFDVATSPQSEVMPVAIKIHADLKIRTEEAAQETFWEAKAVREINGDDWNGGAGAAKVSAHVATLRLCVGESVDLDFWFVPSVEQLKAYFDWPETLAVKVARDDNIPTSDLPAYRQAIINKLRSVLFKPPANETEAQKKEREKAAVAANQAILGRYGAQPPWVGLGGMMVDPAAVAVAAQILHDHMLLFPIPEIAAIRTIDAVHAIARPPRAPAFKKDDKLAVLRAPSDDSLREQLLKSPNPQLGKRGDDGIFFSGTVEMDRDTCRQLEIRAHCVSPARKVFDDTARGRTELQRLLGEWPGRIVSKDVIEGGSPSDEFIFSQSAKFLFGFDVDRRGKVYLPKQWITLLQVDDLKEDASVKGFANLETIDLVKEQKATLQRRREGRLSDDEKKTGAIRAAPLDRYSDRLAREITVALRVTSRFDSHFLRLGTSKDLPLPETTFPPIPSDVDELITRVSYSDENGKKLGQFSYEHVDAPEQLRTLWIPATVAPAKPQVHAILPSYAITRLAPFEKEAGTPETVPECWDYCRTPRVRILLERPWFSSGEGERLGLVLWPPRLREITDAEGGIDRLTEGKVPRSVLHGSPPATADLMELPDFLDEDLGPGGKFTTRWGADPIRSNTGPIGPFMPREVFADLRPATDPNEVGYEPDIAIPLEDLRAEDEKLEAQRRIEDESNAKKLDKIDDTSKGEKPTDASKDDKKAYDTLTASLVTYEPRFDVESEKWFVDVALNPDTVVEPFVRFGLVRYQQHALDGLRVSAPVASWGQVLPGRTVAVRSFRQKNGDQIVKVQVSGHASGRSSEEVIDGKVSLVYPRMRISVVQTCSTGSVLRSERLAETKTLDGRRDPAVIWAEYRDPPEVNGGRESARVWLARFVLKQLEKRPAELEQDYYSILIEEVEDFLSTADESAAPQAVANANPDLVNPDTATPSDGRPVLAKEEPSEPVDVRKISEDEVRDGISRSGPRFLARIDLTFVPKPAKAAGQAPVPVEPPYLPVPPKPSAGERGRPKRPLVTRRPRRRRTNERTAN